MRESKKYKVFLSGAMIFFICAAGGITSFAYRRPTIITSDETDINVHTTDYVLKLEPTPQEKLVSDYFAVSDGGDVYDLYQEDENSGTICRHNYSVPVEVTQHVKEKDDCTVKIYEGLKCTKCNDVKIGEKLNMVTCSPCTHYGMESHGYGEE